MTVLTQIVLLVVVSGLFFFMIRECFKFTKGPASIKNLHTHLLLLQSKFVNHLPVDPEQERRVMEVLQNEIKTSCSEEVIAANASIRTLFSSNCRSINTEIKLAPADGKMPWLKYGELMNSFNGHYFLSEKAKSIQFVKS